MILSKNFAVTFLEGNLTADPELKKVGNGKVLTTFSIAVNHSYKDESEEVSYVDVETWDTLAENCHEYLKKGRSVTIIGNLKQDRWKSSDGVNKSRMKIVALEVRFNPIERSSYKEAKEEKKAA
jgi:single-strand DNA-binding protein